MKRITFRSRAVFFGGVVAAAACNEAMPPERRIPASVDIVGSPVASAVVGAFAGNLTVRVLDSDGDPVPGIAVNFSVSQGGGILDPITDTTRTDGSATTAYTVPTIPTQNVLAATVSGLAPVKSHVIAAVPSAPQSITFNRRDLRLIAIQATTSIAGVVRDSFGNNTGGQITWTSRNPGLVSITSSTASTATLQVQTRPGQTFLVATSGAIQDSVPVFVLDASSTECTFRADPVTLAVGASLPVGSNGLACIRSNDADAEYALILHNNTPASTVISTADVLARGIFSPAAITTTAAATSATPGFESTLRRRERNELPLYLPAARDWYSRRAPAALVAAAREGDQSSVNVNALEFCGSPITRTARVVAVTNTAVILADTENPDGGFTDEEYRSLGHAMDTLVHPLIADAFGTPHDIDGNGRVSILFTRAVNELTPRGSTGGVVLGFFFARDLLPKQSLLGACPGSNVSEMFYLLVPDTAGVAGDRRSKDFVRGITVSTIAHEYQHLVNASVRLFNPAAAAVEEVWLNEGLSHIAEELLFYRASNRQPRQNMGADGLAEGTSTRASFETYLRGNFARYAHYLTSPSLHSPIDTDDALATRGAAWGYLRYVADRAFENDGDFWSRLVSSHLTGVANIEQALQAKGSALSFLGTLNDWSVSIFTDDRFAAPAESSFQLPSFNFLTGLPAVGIAYPLDPPALTHGIVNAVPVKAGGSAYMQFGVRLNQEALVQIVGSNATALSQSFRIHIVRTR